MGVQAAMAVMSLVEHRRAELTAWETIADGKCQLWGLLKPHKVPTWSHVEGIAGTCKELTTSLVEPCGRLAECRPSVNIGFVWTKPRVMERWPNEATHPEYHLNSGGGIEAITSLVEHG